MRFLYRIEWASDPAAPWTLDRWDVFSCSADARRAATAVLLATGLNWLRMVRFREVEPFVWRDGASACPGLPELADWRRRALPRSGAGRGFEQTPDMLDARERLIAAAAAVARWAVDHSVMDDAGARAFCSKAALLAA